MLVESRRVPLGGQVRFLCRMEADPADLELSWYLNNTINERRPLFAGNNNGNGNNYPPGNAQLNHKPSSDHWRVPFKPIASNSVNNNKTSRLVARTQKTVLSGHSASSQLNYLVDTHLDYGRLYCVARNSMGEQKRACVYDIEPGESKSGRKAAQLG